MYYINSLSVSGELNGTDIKLIRDMLLNGFLTHLDIHDARIVSGGEPYYTSYSSDYYTQNDTIGDHMFEKSKYLAEIKLPVGLKAIGDYAFYSCSSLESVEMPMTLECIGSNAFSGCSNLKNLDIPEGIKKLGYNVMRDCVNLMSLSIPSSVQYVDNGSLSNCTSLSEIFCHVMDIGKLKSSSYGKAGDLKAFNDIAANCVWHVVKGKADLYITQSWWKDTWTIIDDITWPDGIDIIEASIFKMDWKDGLLTINSDTDGIIRIYSINGSMIKTVMVESGKQYIVELPRGMYIINNKKVFLK